jgi:hypothetical protein
MEHPAYQATQSTPPTSDAALASMPPQKPSGRNWKKWFVMFLIVDLLVLTGIYFFVLSRQTPQPQKSVSKTAPSPSPASNPAKADPTADWKTYTNSEYNFSFKYPPQYSVTPLTETKKSYNNGNPLEITEFGFPFSLGKMFNGAPDQSGFILEIRPTLGKTIAEEYGNSPALGGGRVEVTYLSETGGAEEAAIIRPSNSGRVYRAGKYFYLVSSIQNLIGDDSTYINLEEIYKTFKFTKKTNETSTIPPLPISTSYKLASTSKISPDGSFIIEEILVGNYVTSIKTKDGNVISDNVALKNEDVLGYSKKFACQCGTSFKGWIDSSTFVLEIRNALAETFEYLVDARTGKVDEASLRRVK